MRFEASGKQNTDATLAAAHARAKELGISEIVIASTSGETGQKALDLFEGFTVVVVTYHAGFRKPFETVMAAEAKKALEDRGARVVQATHALSGVERSFAKQFSGAYPVLIMAETLRLFGQGLKVAVEISIMAADSGALSGRDIISIGGTARGVDCALVLKPANQSDVMSMKIREVICKPAEF